MGVSSNSFLGKLAIFSIITFGILYLFQQLFTPSFQTRFFWVIWLFFIATTALIHFILTNAAKENSKKFVVYYMGITGIKLFSYLIIILMYGLLDRENIQGFVVFFLISYFLFSGFEVLTLLKQFKK